MTKLNEWNKAKRSQATQLFEPTSRLHLRLQTYHKWLVHKSLSLTSSFDAELRTLKTKINELTNNNMIVSNFLTGLK